jgi:hypothetical protein
LLPASELTKHGFSSVKHKIIPWQLLSAEWANSTSGILGCGKSFFESREAVGAN